MTGCIIFYNDGPKMLERALRSMKNHGVDEIIGVDGGYKEFPDQSENKSGSNDGCFEVAEKYCKMLFSAPSLEGWDSQIQKRNCYLKAVEDAEYFLILDADEKLTTNINEDALTEDEYSVWMIEPKGNAQYPSNRIFYKYYDMVYRNRHSAIYRTSLIKNEKDVFSGLINRISNLPYAHNGRGEFIILEHYPYQRSQKRKEQDGWYMENRKTEIDVPMRQTEIDETEDTPITIKYYGNKPYNGYLCPNIQPGQIFEVPVWRFKKLYWDYGPFRFRKFNNV